MSEWYTLIHPVVDDQPSLTTIKDCGDDDDDGDDGWS